MAQKKIDRPEDFTAQVAALPVKQLSERYGVGKRAIERWRRDVGVVHPQRTVKQIAPPDFKTKAAVMRNGELTLHYRVAERTITRWRQETGVPSPASFTGSIHKAGIAKGTSFVPQGDQSTAGLAADFLRRIYRPVYNRKVERKELDGTYVVGRNIMTADEMIQLAREKGYSLEAYA